MSFLSLHIFVYFHLLTNNRFHSMNFRQFSAIASVHRIMFSENASHTLTVKMFYINVSVYGVIRYFSVYIYIFKIYTHNKTFTFTPISRITGLLRNKIMWNLHHFIADMSSQQLQRKIKISLIEITIPQRNPRRRNKRVSAHASR